MSTLVKEYLKDYYEEITPKDIKRKELLKVNRVLFALVDIDVAIKKLQSEYTDKEWEAFTLLVQGYSYRYTTEQTGVHPVDRLFDKICRKIAREAGREYLDTYLLNIILFELKAIEKRDKRRTKRGKLEKEEIKFIFEKFNMAEEQRRSIHAHVTIFNFGYDVFNNLGAICSECGSFVRGKQFCRHYRFVKKEDDYDRLEQI